MISVYSYGVDSGVSNNAPIETINKVRTDKDTDKSFVGFEDIMKELNYSSDNSLLASSSQFIPLDQVAKKVHIINNNKSITNAKKQVKNDNNISYEKKLVKNDIESILKHLQAVAEKQQYPNNNLTSVNSASDKVISNEKPKINQKQNKNLKMVEEYSWSDLETTLLTNDQKVLAKSINDTNTSSIKKVTISSKSTNDIIVLEKLNHALNKIIPNFDERNLNIKAVQFENSDNQDKKIISNSKILNNSIIINSDKKKELISTNSESLKSEIIENASTESSVKKNKKTIESSKNSDFINSMIKTTNLKNKDIITKNLEETFANISRLNNNNKQNTDKIQLNKEVSPSDEKITVKQNKNGSGLNSNSLSNEITQKSTLKHDISSTYNFSTFSRIDEFADRTTQMIKSQPVNSVQTARILLQPESLGTLFVKIELNQGTVNLKIEAENKETVKNIESQIFLLKEKMTQQGLKIENIELGVRNNDEYANQQDSYKRKPEVENKKLMKDFLSSFKLENDFIEQNVL